MTDNSRPVVSSWPAAPGKQSWATKAGWSAAEIYPPLEDPLKAGQPPTRTQSKESGSDAG